MSNQMRLMILISTLSVLTRFAQATPVDVNGDGKVGPPEIFDLLGSWGGTALPPDGTQPWQINGTDIFYNAGNVGIGTNAPTSRLEILGQDGLAITGFQPFLTLRDTNSGGARSLIAGGNGDFGFYTQSTIGGNPAVIIRSNNNNVGIGTPDPGASVRLHVITNTDFGQGIRGEAPSGVGVAGINARKEFGATEGFNSATDGIGVYGQADAGFAARGVWGNSNEGTGVYGFCNSAQGTDSAGVLGRNTAENGNGVVGEANTGVGAYGVLGRSTNGAGVYGNGGYYGVYGVANVSGGYGVYGTAPGDGYAGYFFGKVVATGGVTQKGSFTTLIDHPLDPANKSLTHTSVESPDMMNIYSGNVTTDATGYAKVILPDYFEALNRDFRYQLTVIGDFAQAVVFKEIADNSFEIKTDKPNVKVSWQVTGLRQDAWAKKNPFVAEADKSESERGKYHHPELYGLPEELAIGNRPVVNKPSSMVVKDE